MFAICTHEIKDTSRWVSALWLVFFSCHFVQFSCAYWWSKGQTKPDFAGRKKTLAKFFLTGALLLEDGKLERSCRNSYWCQREDGGKNETTCTVGVNPHHKCNN